MLLLLATYLTAAATQATVVSRAETNTSVQPQLFECSFVLQYSNTIYAIQLFVCNHVGLHFALFVRPLGVGMHTIGGTYLVT